MRGLGLRSDASVGVCLLALVLAVLLLASAPARSQGVRPAAWKQGDPCPQVLVLGARGSSQEFDLDAELGLGEDVYGFASRLTAVLQDAGITVGAQAVPYTAAGVFSVDPDLFESAELGIVIARSMLEDVYEQCGEQTQVVVAGFSQGAMVARGAVAPPHDAYHGIVSALVLIGDPHYNPDDEGLRLGAPTERTGILGPKPLASLRTMTTLHVCVAGDIICQWGGGGEIPDDLTTFEAYATHVSAYKEPTIQFGAAALTAQRVRFRCGHRGATILGTPGDDELVGTPGDDVIVGFGGDDTIDGGGGDDAICADAVDGSAEGGADHVTGGFGDDYVEGGGGDDVLDGGGGLDVLVGQSGDDRLQNGQHLEGGGGEDVLLATTTDSFPSGGFSTFAIAPSFLDGGDDDDVVSAPDGAGFVSGGAGDDRVSASSGYLDGGEGNDVLTGGDSGQYLDGGDGVDVLSAGGGDDYLDGGPGRDELRAGAGYDYLDGGDGADVLWAGDDDDYLDGGEDADLLWGEAGMDFFDAGAGDDVLEARDETRDQFFVCGDGRDVLRIDAIESEPELQDGCEPEVQDEIAPTISIAAPADGADLDLGASVQVSFTCADDGGSGVASCDGTVADGAMLDTSSRGRKTFTVTATDAAGNRRTASVSYLVRSVQTIAFPTPAPRRYGDEPFTPEAVASSGQPVTLGASGACRIVDDRVELTAAGSCTIVADAGADDEFRSADSVVRTFAVAKARLLATATDATVVYGAPLALTGTLTGVVGDDGIAATDWVSAGGSRPDVGARAISPVLSDPLGRLANYELELSGTLTVDPRPLRVVADDVMRPFGADAPLTGTVTGALDGDQISGRFTTSAMQTSLPGRYAIRAEAIAESDVLANYTLELQDGVLTIVDEHAPALVVPDEIVAEATGPDGAVVDFGERVSATDDAAGELAVVCAPPSGSLFALGTTTVTCSADDGTHRATAAFPVRVVDPPATAPTIENVPADITVTRAPAAGVAVSYTRPTATDARDGAIPVSCAPPSGSTFPLGATQVICTAVNSAGIGATAAFTVTVVSRTLRVIAQPTSLTVRAGETASFSAAASGLPTPTVQWQQRPPGGAWTDLADGTSSSYSLVAEAADNGYRYRAVFTSGARTVTTAAASLTVHSPPVIVTQPSAREVAAGRKVSFSAAATGFPAPAIQWQESSDGVLFTDVVGATKKTYTFRPTPAEDGQRVRAVFANLAGTVATEPALLTVWIRPTIIAQPAAQAVTVGQTARFSAAAAGRPTPTVQWQARAPGGAWADVPGATAPDYAVLATPALNRYRFRAVFANQAGSATTQAARLTMR